MMLSVAMSLFLQRHRVFVHESPDVRAVIRWRTDITKRLGILQSKRFSEQSPILHQEALHILEVSRGVVIPEQRQALALRRQFLPQARAVSAGRAFTAVRDVAASLRVDIRA